MSARTGLHLRVGHRGAPRQGRRPGLRRGARRGARRRTRYGRVACETLLTTGLCVVAGGDHDDGAPRRARARPRDDRRHRLRRRRRRGSTATPARSWSSLDRQSPEIAAGVDAAFEHRTGAGGEDVRNAQGAGDQGMMFGYACDETEDLLPLPIWLAHRLSMRLAQVRRTGQLSTCGPTARRRSRVAYEGARPVGIETIVVSAQHADGVSQDVIRRGPARPRDRPGRAEGPRRRRPRRSTRTPPGAFVFGGPSADTGLTGRKIIVDTYGGMARHGGGAFSGKDPSKVDRSGRLRGALGRQARRRLGCRAALRGARRLRDRRRSPGLDRPRDVRHRRRRPREARPTRSASCSTCGPPRSSTSSSCAGPMYRKTAAYGHFGRTEREFTWEQTPRADELRRALGL